MVHPKEKEYKKNPCIAYISSHKLFLFELIVLIVIAALFRFYNYDNRWGLASDQARDALVAIAAVRLHTIPLIGPFSASGPFVFGPYMYWFLILIRILYPFSFFAFWIGMTLTSVLMVLFSVLIGKEIKGINFGMFLAFFAAISPAKVGMATNLISSTLAGYISTIAVYFFIRAVKYSNSRDFFLLGLFVGISINTHFQAIPLLVLLPLAWIFAQKTLKKVFYLIIGLFIPFIPLIIFDLRTHFYESTHLFQYFFERTPVQITTRWLTFVGQTLPQIFRLIIGGNSLVAYPLFVISILFFIYLFFTKKIDRVIAATGTALLVIIILLRYFQGQLFGDFTAFLQTIVLILICYALWKALSIQKYIACILILVVAISTMRSGYRRVSSATDTASDNAQKLQNILISHYPHNASFVVYDYEYKSSELSLPLSLYLDDSNKNKTQPVKIGVTNSYISGNLFYKEDSLYFEYLYDLSSHSDSDLKKIGWVKVAPESVYNSVGNWYK